MSLELFIKYVGVLVKLGFTNTCTEFALLLTFTEISLRVGHL